VATRKLVNYKCIFYWKSVFFPTFFICSRYGRDIGELRLGCRKDIIDEEQDEAMERGVVGSRRGRFVEVPSYSSHLEVGRKTTENLPAVASQVKLSQGCR